MKLVNPLYYPWAVLVGGISLIVGIRLIQLPSLIMLPTAAALATVFSIPLSQKEANKIHLDNPALAREIQSVQQQAQLLINKAEDLRHEAKQVLTSSTQLELLTAVEYACERTSELPVKISQLARRLQGSDSLLSPAELAQQLAEAKARQRNSSGVAKEQLKQLVASLENNLRLAQQGQDARQAQVVSLNTLVIESAGILQPTFRTSKCKIK